MAQHATRARIEPSLKRFAERLRTDVGASHILLFGSRARDNAAPDSDYDLIVVAERFAGMDPAVRARGLRAIWHDTGGDGPMDIICLSPQEFEQAQGRISLISAVLPQAIDLLAA
ncbi:MAG TPA: nucleotidyltransferase domain-containing protein [Thermomicrobiales bacterium]|nr:nucleotidyltransferase domain-containing protein [Thermomicrobiales bacterium]